MRTGTFNLETRNYRIVELLGRGGFGKVYRARMEGAGGFSKDVALKLLNDRDPAEDVLQRFRDESRILGLVRDRAIIGVEPPTQLGGRWAIIMEYVPGASCQALLKHRGVFPPRVALAVVQEVARALDHVYNQVGPDGQRLELVHRDIKPGNIQLTRAGEVKLLDFGVARARFEAREAHTTRSIQGTYGYIAPERLQGRDTPAADVFSLGMVLYKLVTGGDTDVKQLHAVRQTEKGGVRAALDVAAAMVAPEPEERPPARQVEELCGTLVHSMTGIDLRHWAEANVPGRVGTDDDELCGKLLTSTLEIREPSQEISTTSSRSGLFLLAGITGVNLLLVVGGIAVVLIASVIALVLAPGAPSPAAPPPPMSVAPVPAPEPVEVAPDPQPPDDPVATEPAPVAPRPVTPAPEPVATFPCDFGSQPLGAEVLLDGKPIGTTPLFGYAVPAGAHKLEMRSAGGSATKKIEVGRRKPKRFVWKGGEEWEVLY